MYSRSEAPSPHHTHQTSYALLSRPNCRHLCTPPREPSPSAPANIKCICTRATSPSFQCKVKFDVSLGKMIETGFTFSFDDCNCYMCTKETGVWKSFAKAGMGRRWLMSTAHVITRTRRTEQQTKRWDWQMMEQEQQWNPGWTNQGMIHHHNDHERYDQVPRDNTI